MQNQMCLVRTLRRPLALALATSATALGGFTLHAQAQIGVMAPGVADDAHDHGLPFLDVRLDAQERVTGRVNNALAAWRGTEAFARREASLRAMRQIVPGLACDDHALMGVPHFLRSTVAFLSRPAKGAPREIARDFLLAQRDLFELDAKDLDDSSVVRDFDTHGIMHHLTYQQMVEGKRVFGAILRINLTARGEVINASSAFTPRPAGGWNVAAPILTAERALRTAARSVGSAIVNPVSAGEVTGAKTQWNVGDELDNWTPVTTEEVFFPISRDELRPAFLVVVPTQGVGHTYEVVIDALTGQVLWRANWLKFDTTQPVTYRVYSSDSPAPWSPGPSTPVTTQAPFVLRDLITVSPASIAPFSPNGWIPDGGTTTTGNNVDAYLDAVSDNLPDAGGRPVSAARVFDLPLSVDASNAPNVAPANYGHASVAHGFYHANLYHDLAYALGFTEGAGNFQTDNFGLGGGANDAVRMEMQDGSGTNNANFSTPTDGNPGRCQMYIFDGPTIDRDGGLDQNILYHELTHGTSTRCHENTLSGAQAGGMGEGWGDFYGVTMTAQSSDDFNGTYATGGFATYQLGGTTWANYYFGIRRFPYSTNMSISPLTYGDIAVLTYDTSIPRNPVVATTSAPGQVHNAGEVWCQTLLEARAFIGIDEGFAANQTVMQLVMDGMKLAPSNPNFLTERDAILQSELVRYGGTHTRRLWQAFAKRGMGFSATSPSTGATAGVVEAFDTPERIIWTFPDGIPSQLSPTSPTSFRVQQTEQLLTITPGTTQMFYRIDSGAFTPGTLTPDGVNAYIATLPAGPCLADVDFYFQAGSSVGDQFDPTGGSSSPYESQVFTGPPPFVSDMETTAGWTVGPNTATTGVWNRMAPQATAAQPGADVSDAGTMCWVTDGNAGTGVGSFDVDGGFTTLNSPVIDMSTLAPTTPVSFWVWYTNNAGGAPNADTFRVDVSNNAGASWTNALTLGPTSPAAAWIQYTITPGSLVALTSTMQVRFIAEDAGTGSIVEAAVDEFTVGDVTCVPGGPVCDSIDFNADGLFPDTLDIDDFLSVFSGGACSNDPNCGDIDFNNDGLFPDTTDIDSLLSVFSGGACL
jgi:hypothetical protein